jgi:hypothetical protein
MHEQDSAFCAAQRLLVRYTGKPVSGWGGLLLLMRYLERRGVPQMLRQALPDGRSSPNQIPVVTMALAFFATVLTGGRRFAHLERLRSDEVIRTILGVTRLPSAMTLTRYFGGFVHAQSEHLSAVLGEFTRARLSSPILGEVLDLDSTVFERYGRQEGSLKGHNPRKHGRPSHHPILAMLAGAKLVLHSWLRSGNTGSARGVSAFLAETLERLPEEFRLYALRADSGFFIHDFMLDLERRKIPYAIAVRLHKLLQHAIVGLTDWQRVGHGLEVAETRYLAPSWKHSRRIVVVRERINERPEATGRKLFDLPGYTFHTVVTTLELPAVEVWRFYNGRADCENRLKELKEDFGANGCCLNSFYGTEAAFRLICCLYNLLAEFKREVTHDSKPRLMSLRSQLLVTGALVGRDGREVVLRLGLRGRFRERFAALLARIALLPNPTVTQLRNIANLQTLSPPRPWKLRPPQRQLAFIGARN